MFIILLCIVIYTYVHAGDGQIACYKDVQDPTLEKCNSREQIGSFLNAQACCRLPNSVFFDTGEACRPCLGELKQLTNLLCGKIKCNLGL